MITELGRSLEWGRGRGGRKVKTGRELISV